MSWNTQKVEDLKKLWNEGVATSRIGEQLGFTKNAVIGKAFRLGLEEDKIHEKKQLPLNNSPLLPCIVKQVFLPPLKLLLKEKSLEEERSSALKRASWALEASSHVSGQLEIL